MAETIKISELAETTDLEGLYTIGTDKNNLSKKVGLGFVKEAANYAIAQGASAKAAAEMYGVTDYPDFSDEASYLVGDVVRYMNKLYRFIAEHRPGIWLGYDAEVTTVNKEAQRKINAVKEYADETFYSGAQFDPAKTNDYVTGYAGPVSGAAGKVLEIGVDLRMQPEIQKAAEDDLDNGIFRNGLVTALDVKRYVEGAIVTTLNTEV